MAAILLEKNLTDWSRSRKSEVKEFNVLGLFLGSPDPVPHHPAARRRQSSIPGVILERLSVVRAPVAVVAGHEAARDQQDQIHEPPDPQTAQREQLPHRRARVAQTETIHPEAAQEEGVEQRGDEVVSRVFDAGDMPSEELSVSGTLDVVQRRADHRGVVHLLLGLTAPPNAAVAQLLEGAVVPRMVHGVLAEHELIR